MRNITSLFCQASQRRTFARYAASQPKKTALPFNLWTAQPKTAFQTNGKQIEINKKEKPIKMSEKQEKLKKKHDRIREQVKAKEARRSQPNNFADIFNLQNNDFDNKFNNKFNGEKK
jgi:hypothetical protein